MKLTKKAVLFLLLSGLLSVSCNLLVWDGDPEPKPNVLQKKDSLAVRAILDTNGLYHIKVHDVIDLYNSNTSAIKLPILTSTTFLFTSAFDSLSSGSIGLYLTYKELDSLVFKDTVHIPLFLSISHTKLKSITDQITFLTGNLTLDLQSNQLHHISSDIIKCKVNFVNVKNNFLCDVTDSINNWISQFSYDSSWKKYQNCN